MDSETPNATSERRQVTVMFADISGFTAISERLDPEEMTALVNRCFDMLGSIITSHGGHVDKYIGDCIMALFGAPKALESAPRQAINAAIEMRNRLEIMNRQEQLPESLELHIAINTGLVLAGYVGGAVKREFTVMGDPVNLASRLKDMTPRGGIYVGHGTYKYTSNEFEYRNLGERRVKGKERGVPVYEVLSVDERVHRPKPPRSGGMIFSELVGREREVDRLRACIRDVMDGRGCIVNLIGEAGLGKSRLVAEIVRGSDLQNLTLLEGRSLSVGQSLSFHPLVDLFRSWAGIAEEDTEQEAAEKLEAAVGNLFATEAGEIFPFVATLMGMRVSGAHAERIAGIEGEAMERLITKTIRDLFERMAGAKPLVLVFEDLHWADISSIKILESLLRLVMTCPVLFVQVLRPAYHQTTERILAFVEKHHSAHLVEITLRPLDTKGCDLLIRNLLNVEDLPYKLRALVTGKSEGNPFFIEEVIRSLVDQGALEHHRGRFRVTADMDAVVIPGTIQEVIMARIDRLPESSRRILQVASVIGRSFRHRILADLVEREDQLELGLSYLKRSQLIEERREGDEIEYVFKHALAQETVYGSILQRTRKDLHIRVARAIEVEFPERLSDFYGVLAYHYSRAEDLERAESYLFKAGDEAARSAAASEALNFFREASRLYFMIHGHGGDLSRKALLEKNIGLALLNTGNMSESIGHFDNALEYLGEPVPRSALGIGVDFCADVIGLLYDLYVRRRRRGPFRDSEKDREVMEVRYNRARAQLTNDPRRYFIDTVGSLRRLGQTDPRAIDQASGMYAGGAALFAYSGLPVTIGKRFLAMAKTLIRPGSIQDLFEYRTMQFVQDYLVLGNWGSESVIEEELVEQALRYGQTWDVFVYRSLNAERKAYRGEFAEAHREIDGLRQLSEVYGFDFARSSEYAMLSILLVAQRRFEEAEEALDLYYANQYEEVFNLFAHGTRAKAQLLRGDRDAAAQSLARATELIARLGQVYSMYHFSVYAVSQFMHAVTALEEDLGGLTTASAHVLKKRARQSSRLALKVARHIVWTQPETFRLAGQHAWLLGRKDRALSWWTRSIEAARRLEAKPDLARTYMEVGQRMGEAGRRTQTVMGMDPAACLESARLLLGELGLAWDLERLDESRDLAAVGG